MKKDKDDKVYVKSPCCPAGVGTRERGGKIVCIDCEKELDFKAVLDMDRYHDYDEDGGGMYMKRSLDTDFTFDSAWAVMKEDMVSMSDIQMMVKEVHDLVQIQGAHPMQAAAMVAEANYPDQRRLGRTLFAEYVKTMS